MGIKQMYKGIANSPQTILTKTIGATDTVIEVAGIDVFPAGPNMAVIGIDEEAETITYATKTATALSGCKRGVEGKAKAWEADSLISRNFTNYDYSTLIDNILALDKEKTSDSDFTSFKDEILKQLEESGTINDSKYATKKELTTTESVLDKKIDAKVSNTTFEDFKNTNKIELDKKTNNADLEVYKKEVTSNLAKKVDKVSGKGLSTNDYTDLEKAEVAKIKNLATSETVTEIKSDVENLKTSKVDKEVGKGLSTNDYNNTEKAEVAKIKNKADKTYVDEKLSDKATVTDLTKKIDKTSITSDLAGTDETKVLSQKAGSLLEDAIKNIDLSGKIDKSSITNDFNGTDIAKVLSQKGANDLFKALSSGDVNVEYTELVNTYFYKITYDKNTEPLIILFSAYNAEKNNNKYVPVGFRPKLETAYISAAWISSGSSEYGSGSFSIQVNGKITVSPTSGGNFLGFTMVYFGTI